jgi:hypothetical protein
MESAIVVVGDPLTAKTAKNMRDGIVHPQRRLRAICPILRKKRFNGW